MMFAPKSTTLISSKFKENLNQLIILQTTCYICLFIFMLLEIEPRLSDVLDKWSATGLFS